MGRKNEMVQGAAFAYLGFFSYIEEERRGRPLGDLDRSRKPFWREFDEYMHRQGEEAFNFSWRGRDSSRRDNPRIRVSVRISPGGNATFCYTTYNTQSFYFLPLYVAPLNACASRSAASVGTDKIRNVFVCPRPPFQPCTATIVHPGLIRFKPTALRSPNRIRLST